jgi:hypothetical protein
MTIPIAPHYNFCKLLPPSIVPPEVARLLPAAHQPDILAIATKTPAKKRQRKIAVESKQGP